MKVAQRGARASRQVNLVHCRGKYSMLLLSSEKEHLPPLAGALVYTIIM